MAKTIVYVLRHTNAGTPESGEIEGVYATRAAAAAAMETVLHKVYEVTPEENAEEDLMWIEPWTVK